MKPDFSIKKNRDAVDPKKVSKEEKEAIIAALQKQMDGLQAEFERFGLEKPSE